MTDRIKDLYEHVFCSSQLQDTPCFGLFTTYPRQCMDPLCQSEIDLPSAIAVELESKDLNFPNPLDYLHDEGDLPALNVKEDAKVLRKADSARQQFMESLALRSSLPFTITRQHVFEEIILLYRNHEQDVLQVYPLELSLLMSEQ